MAITESLEITCLSGATDDSEALADILAAAGVPSRVIPLDAALSASRRPAEVIFAVMDGVTVENLLKLQGARRAAPLRFVVAVAPSLSERQRHAADIAGANAFLLMPVQPETVARVLDVLPLRRAA